MKLTLSYAGLVMLAGTFLLAAVWLYLLRYVPDQLITSTPIHTGVFPVRSRLLHAFAPKALEVLAFLFVLSLVGGWFLAGRMLSPLRRITEATRAADAGSLSHRIQLSGRSDEFRELADAFDEMLARLEAQVAEQQRFAANASHELRTPLAITQTLLDVARNDPDRDVDELVHRLRLANSRAIDLTEALLVLSRSDQRAFTKEPVDIALVVEDAIETLIPLAEKYDVTLETSGATEFVMGSRTLLLQLVTNLVHNGIVHNLETDGRVWLTTILENDRVVVTVENTGEMLSAELVSTLVEPFRRGSDRIRSDQAGVGLGLAIAKSVIDAHEGTMALTARVDGGLRVALSLLHESSDDA